MRARAVGGLGGVVFFRPPGCHIGWLRGVSVAEEPSLGGRGVHVPDTREIVFRGGCGSRRGLGGSSLLTGLSGQSGGKRYTRERSEKERANAIAHSEILPWGKDCAARNIAAAIVNFLVPATRRKFFATAHHDFLNPNFASAALGRIAADRDGVSGLNGALGPSNPGQSIGAGELSLPFLDRSGVVFGFPKNLHVRIDEIESCRHALHGYRLVRFVVRRAVVRIRPGSKCQKPQRQGQKPHSSNFHFFPLSFFIRESSRQFRRRPPFKGPTIPIRRIIDQDCFKYL